MPTEKTQKSVAKSRSKRNDARFLITGAKDCLNKCLGLSILEMAPREKVSVLINKISDLETRSNNPEEVFFV